MNQHLLKVKILACILLHNICIEKETSISLKLGMSYDKEELRKTLKMVSSKCYVDASKGAAILTNNICDFFSNKKESHFGL